MIIETHRIAEGEINETIDYFNQHGMKPSQAFLDELREVYQSILDFPNSGVPTLRHCRYKHLKTYSYGVYYRVWPDDRIVVYCVAHDHQRHGYWRGRVYRE